MGTDQSSRANGNHGTIPASFSEKEGVNQPLPVSAGGRKSNPAPKEAAFLVTLEEAASNKSDVANLVATDDEEMTDEDSVMTEESEEDSDEEDEEEDEEWEERLRILEDARNLKKVAGFFLHPEREIAVDGTAVARCFFDRPSAPERASFEDEYEHDLIMQDLQDLKKLAVVYMHPEREVEVDGTATARCFFDRPSAPERASFEDEYEHDLVLEDLRALKSLAVAYMHPEHPCVTEDPTVLGRNYFTRASAPEQDLEEATERALVLAEAKELKKLALWHRHPENPVEVEDPTLFGRNYFARPSAPEQEDLEEAAERVRILAEAEELKKLAVDFMHPERPVVVDDPAVFGRNFFSRAAAIPQEDLEEAAEKARVLAEVKDLKKLADWHLHPEKPVEVEDSTLFGRNYFARPSAPEQEDLEAAAERTRILAEAKQLKKLAVDFMHPERPVVVDDPTLFGRNFFSRASAVPQEDLEDATERANILADAKQLKKLAVHYMHPEIPVVTEDPTSFGRNVFSRPSAAGHHGMIHTFPAHEDEIHHDDHDHVDHFGMDEDMDHMFDDMREHLDVPTGGEKTKTVGSNPDDAESNLSRSPSSVMLFTGDN